jgi:cell division protein FtsZ
VRREDLVKVERPRIVARTGTDNMPMSDYAPLGRTTPTRAPAEPAKTQPAAEPQVDYLDIPAFLRRQAD